MKIQPLNDQVLIKVDSAEEVSPGGLILVSADPVVKNSGVVEAVGDADVIKIKPGDRVLFEKGMGRRFEFPVQKESVDGVKYSDTVPYILIAYFDIVAILEG